MQKARAHFGAKAALEVALRADADQRSAERWLSQSARPKAPTSENLANLLRSDFGRHALEAIMGPDAKAWPAWYRGFRRQLQISEVRQSLMSQQRTLAALEESTL
jgi:hypothetical protein